jgi:hypothetical protein
VTIKPNTVVDLEAENARLRARIASLEQQLEWLANHKTLAQGLSGEVLISNIIDGAPTVHTAPHDVTAIDGTKIEVKKSKLTNPNPRKNTTSRRWIWNKIFGETGKKDFDFLILIGEAHPHHIDLYRTRDPFVMFCVPYDEIFALTTNGPRGARCITLAANPSRVSGVSAILYTHYQVSVDEIEQRFGRLARDTTASPP